MYSNYKEYIVPMRPKTLGTWLETIAITMAAIALGYLYSPADPLLVKAQFPWTLFAPLLVAVRYGFLPGLLSVGLIMVGLLISNGLSADRLPASYIIGMLLTTFLVSEFRDLWYKKLTALTMANQYRQYRLDDFTRSYRLLKVSHDELELRIAGSSHSMRNTLLQLRHRLQNTETGQQNKLASVAEQAMQVFSQYGAFTSAALYSVEQNHSVNLNPLVVLGDMPVLAADDVLLSACLETKHTVSIRDYLLSQGANPSQLQVCVPLLDTEKNWVGVLAIAQIPFFSMTEQTLNLLTLLAGYVADVLSSDSNAIKLSNPHAQHFSQQLQRVYSNCKSFDLSGVICAFEFHTNNTELRKLLEQSQRGLDIQLELINSKDHHLLLVLQPLVTAKGFTKYIERISELITQQYPDMDLRKLNVRVHKLQLDQASTADLKRFIYQECNLDEQQVAI